MEIEPKITEVELIRDHEKNPLEPQALKECKLYLNLIKTDRYRIKNLVECFPPNPAKRQRESLGLLIRKLTLNVRTEGLPSPLHMRKKARQIENVPCLGREREN